MKSILKHIPNKNVKTMLVQGHVEDTIAKRAYEIKKELNLTWDELLSGLFKSLIEEIDGNKSK